MIVESEKMADQEQPDDVIIEEIVDQLIDGVEILIGLTENTFCSSLVSQSQSQYTEEQQVAGQLGCMTQTVSVVGGCLAAMVDMADAATSMSQESLEVSDYYNGMTVETQSVGTSMSQDYIEEKPKLRSAGTSMSQEFLSQPKQGMETIDASTSSFDLIDLAEACTWMDYEEELKPPSPRQQCSHQVVPTAVYNLTHNISDESEFFGTKKRRRSSENKSMTLDHLVPDGYDVVRKKEISTLRHKPASRNHSNPESEEFGNQSCQTSKQSLIYQYEEVDDYKENVVPDFSHGLDGMEDLPENVNRMKSLASSPTFSNQIPLSISPRVSPGILRLGLSRRSKPSKQLHNISLPRL